MAVEIPPSERLADFVLSLRYEDLPAPVVEKARQLLLDWLGVACGGRVLADSST
jgi:2-methylcitrate dehydratase PrpD